MKIREDDLQLVVLPCREPVLPVFNEHYNACYQLWEDIWSKTLEDLDGVEKLHSNEFTRHDYLSAIFKGKQAISLMCYSEVDIKLKARHNDSWFSCWPSEILNEQKNREGLGLIASWFCTHPEFRKGAAQALDLNVSQVIIEVFGKLVVEGSYNVGYGITRNNRGVDKYSDNAGGVNIATSKAHGCDVNLVLFEPSLIKEKQLSYSDELKLLWKNRIDFRYNFKGKNDEQIFDRPA